MTRTLHRLPLTLSLSVLALAGCPAEEVPTETNGTETGDGDGDPGDGDGDGDGDGAPGDGDGMPGDGDGAPGPECGNGELEDGEACDDGNTDDGDGCSSTCQVSECGLVWSTTVDVPTTALGANDVVVADDGSIYAAGLMPGPNDDDAWLAKWNADGTLAWEVMHDGGMGGDSFLSLAIGAGGEIYVAGRTAGDGDDIWYAELAAADGAVVWQQVVTGPMEVMGGDDIGSGIAVTPDGDLVVVGRLRVGDGDDDVWVRKADAGDGSEIWTETWTGVGDGMFSTDRVGAVSVAPDGSVWVAAREHIAFDTQDATLLHFDADGMLVDAFQPLLGGAHQHDPVDVLAIDGAIYFAVQKGQFPFRSWLYKLGTDGSEMWVKTEADWMAAAMDLGDTWQTRGLGLDSDGNLGVGGSFENEEEGQGVVWSEAWVSKLDADGNVVCWGHHMAEDGASLPPSVFVNASGYSDGGFGLVGIQTSSQGNMHKLWTGMFMK